MVERRADRQVVVLAKAASTIAPSAVERGERRVGALAPLEAVDRGDRGRVDPADVLPGAVDEGGVLADAADRAGRRRGGQGAAGGGRERVVSRWTS